LQGHRIRYETKSWLHREPVFCSRLRPLQRIAYTLTSPPLTEAMATSSIPTTMPSAEIRAANRHRFELGLEFVQSLANPHYLQSLAQEHPLSTLVRALPGLFAILDWTGVRSFCCIPPRTSSFITSSESGIPRGIEEYCDSAMAE